MRDVTDARDRASERRDATQRIRIGLTGLAGVLVLVLLAAAVLGLRSADSGLMLANGARADGRVEPGAEAPKDPLAELGVTPGGSGEQPVTNVTAPDSPAPAPGRPRATPRAVARPLPAH